MMRGVGHSEVSQPYSSHRPRLHLNTQINMALRFKMMRVIKGGPLTFQQDPDLKYHMTSRGGRSSQSCIEIKQNQESLSRQHSVYRQVWVSESES
jgi:hypothetical protein